MYHTWQQEGNIEKPQPRPSRKEAESSIPSGIDPRLV